MKKAITAIAISVASISAYAGQFQMDLARTGFVNFSAPGAVAPFDVSSGTLLFTGPDPYNATHLDSISITFGSNTYTTGFCLNGNCNSSTGKDFTAYNLAGPINSIQVALGSPGGPSQVAYAIQDSVWRVLLPIYATPVEASTVPLPGTLILTGLGLIGALFPRMRKLVA